MITRTALLILLAAGALAQDKSVQDKPRPDRDPFAPSERMREGPDRFVARDTAGALPKLELRGYIEGADGTTVALLEVEAKSVYLVRKGDTVSLPQGGGSLVMRVVELTNLELRVELGELRRVMVIR